MTKEKLKGIVNASIDSKEIKEESEEAETTSVTTSSESSSSSESEEDDNISDSDDDEEEEEGEEENNQMFERQALVSSYDAQDGSTVMRVGLKPNIDPTKVQNTALLNRLRQFIPELAAANKELELEKEQGTLGNRKIELEDDYDQTKQHIEMNLGLGVLQDQQTIDHDEDQVGQLLDPIQNAINKRKFNNVEQVNDAKTKKHRIEEV